MAKKSKDKDIIEDAVEETVEELTDGKDVEDAETVEDAPEAEADDVTDAEDASAEEAEDASFEDAVEAADEAVEDATAEVQEEPEVSEPDEEPAAQQVADEEHGGSLASKVLTWLVLLLAGGGIALWGAPKVAPQLPDGLGPVKSWLLPGESAARKDIAALREDLETRLAALPEPVSAEDVSGQIGDATEAVSADMSAQMAELQKTLSETAGVDTEARISSIETQIAGLASQLTGLTDALAGAEAQGLDPETAAQIAGFSSTVEGLKAEIAKLAENDGALRQQLANVAQQAEARVEAAETQKDNAALRAALSQMSGAVSTGAPFGDALGVIAGEGGEAAPEVLVAKAETGVVTLAVLRDRFPDAAKTAIQASIKSEAGGSVAGRLGAFLESQVATRSLEPQEGDSADAVLSRAEAALRQDDLAGALQELDGLPEPAAQAMSGWLDDARARVAALKALDELNATALGTN